MKSEHRSIEERAFALTLRGLADKDIFVCRDAPCKQTCYLCVDRVHMWLVVLACEKHPNEEEVYAKCEDLGPRVWEMPLGTQEERQLTACKDINRVKRAFGSAVLKYAKQAFRDKSSWLEVRLSLPCCGIGHSTLARAESLEKMLVEMDFLT